MKCPTCGLINPDTAERCDCGYDFASKTIKTSYLHREAIDRLSRIPDLERMSLSKLDRASLDSLQTELNNGARLMVYAYCVSYGIATIRGTTRVMVLPPGESPVRQALPYTIVSLLLGWWGIPWGPLHTIEALKTNLNGGIDVTSDVASHVAATIGGVPA